MNFEGEGEAKCIAREGRLAARDPEIDDWPLCSGLGGGPGRPFPAGAAPPASPSIEPRSWAEATTASPRSPALHIRDRDRDSDPFADELLSLVDFLGKFARALTRNHDEAEELVQDALLQAWRHRARFQPGTNLRGWVGTILRNQFFARRRRLRIVSSPGSELELERLQAPDTASTALELSELDRSLGALPADQREAILLVALGYSYEEAAEAMNCPVGTAKSRVFRGRAMLQAQLDEPPGEAQSRPRA